MYSLDQPTVLIDDFKVILCESVYEPSDDTYLLYDTIKNLSLRMSRVAEIGSGTGLLTLALARHNIILATDLNLKAVKCTLKNLKINGLYTNADLICCDSLKPVRENELFDYIIFNPPYIPTDTQEDIAWSGGVGGIEVTEKFLLDSAKRLKKHGKILCVISSNMDLKKLFKFIEKLGFKTAFLSSKKFFFEELHIAILERKSLYNH